jgi:bile acid:Na+ symporter, BASS family
MLGAKEIILLTIITLASVAGLVWPVQATLFSPYLSYLMGCMLFFSFLKIAPKDVWAALKIRPGALVVLGALKLFILPALVYLLARLTVPEFALGLLLVAGTATGVTAPFFTAVAGGNVALTLVMAAATSLILPLSLPLMCRLMAGQNFQFDLIGMALLLMAIIFIPLAAVWLGRLVIPRVLDGINKVSYPLSLTVMSLINFGAFGRYAEYLTGNPAQVLLATLLSCLLFLLQAALGWLICRSWTGPDRLAAAGSLVWINNVLIIVLGAEIGDPLTSVLAAIYMIPLFVSVALMGPLDRALFERKK